MKSKILLGAMAAAALCGTDAMAQISYQNGDLLAGFRKSGSPDVILDLGSISLYQQAEYSAGYPSFQVNANLSDAFTTTFGTLSGVTWSVFGVNDTTLGSSPLGAQTDPNTVWVTKKRNNPTIQSSVPTVSGNSDSQHLTLLDIKAIGSFTTPDQASPGVIQNISAGIISIDGSQTLYTPDMTGAFSGNFEGTWAYNIENSGPGVEDLYLNNPGTGKASYLGNFALDSTGNLMFNPVPEPSTWAMMGVGMLSLLATRRFRNGSK